MKYNKQWTLSETVMSLVGNLRKTLSTTYHVRSDHDRIYIWTKEEFPELKLILCVERTLSAEQAAFQELSPEDRVRKVRVAGSFIDIDEKVMKLL